MLINPAINSAVDCTVDSAVGCTVDYSVGLAVNPADDCTIRCATVNLASEHTVDCTIDLAVNSADDCTVGLAVNSAVDCSVVLALYLAVNLSQIWLLIVLLNLLLIWLTASSPQFCFMKFFPCTSPCCKSTSTSFLSNVSPRDEVKISLFNIFDG